MPLATSIPKPFPLKWRWKPSAGTIELISTTPVIPTAPPSALPTSRACIRSSIEKSSSNQAAEKGPQLRSRFDKILNVPQRVRLRFSLTCGLVGRLFEQPATSIRILVAYDTNICRVYNCTAPTALTLGTHV